MTRLLLLLLWLLTQQLFIPNVSAFYPPSTTMMNEPLWVSKTGAVGQIMLFQEPSGMALQASTSDPNLVAATGVDGDDDKDGSSVFLQQFMTLDDSSTAAAAAAAAAFVTNLQSKRPKMIVFDKDGTLGDCTASLRKWVHHMTDRIRAALTPTNHSSSHQADKILADFYHRIGWDATKNDVVPSAPVAAGTWEDIVTLLYTFLLEHQDRMEDHIVVSRALAQEWHAELGDLHGHDAPLLDDLRGMMVACRQLGYTVGICTSDDRHGTEAAIRAWQIRDVVDVSICGDEVTEGKPSAVPLQKLCQLAQTQQGQTYLPQDVIVVGDTSSDTGMARAAKAGFCVGVLTGSGTTEQLLETGAHLILPSVGHIPALLETLERLSEERHEPQ